MRVGGTIITSLSLALIVGTAATASDVRAVPTPPADVAACDIVISILDERGDTLDTPSSGRAGGNGA